MANSKIPRPTKTANGYSVRVRYGAGMRKRLAYQARHEAEADRRAAELQQLADLLAQAGDSELAADLLDRYASATDEQERRKVQRVAEGLTSGKYLPPAKQGRSEVTFTDVAEQWLSGELHRKYQDHVRPIRDVETPRGRLDRLCKSLGDRPVADITLEDCEAAMAALPAGLTSNTRNKYAVYLHRVLALAVYPLKLREASPMPPGWLPNVGEPPVSPYLYPDEEAKLLACKDVPFADRLLYAVLGREGMRCSEALGLTWANVDLVRGALSVPRNKTMRFKNWAMRADVTAALRLVKPENAKPTDRVFATLDETSAHRAEPFRDHCLQAGIDRAELYAERTETTRPLNVHSLRAGFVTLSLAAGKTEAWVMDRTGHTTSTMLHRYNRQARMAQELGLGELGSMVELIPELRPEDQTAQGGPQGGPQTRIQPRQATAPEYISHPAANGKTSEAENTLGRAAGECTKVHEDGARPTLPAQGEGDLDVAVRLAAEAERWDLVALLGRELEARRLAKAGNVLPFESARRRGDR